MATTRADEKVIFNTAWRIVDTAERQAYLDNACGQDNILRARLEDLLRVIDDDPDFLEPAQTKSDTAEPPIQQPGTMVDRYKLLELIGQGGMGEVWMAEQREPVKRLVAIKLIKAGRDSRQVMARFAAERQALAMMDHPNIARVFDAGESPTVAADGSGIPFFVMELVKGKSITQYCDEKRLSLHERLALFVPVCQAIQHAHQKGVIHRDIKPNNVLIGLYDGRPVPKVIDFGVAKAAGVELTDLTLHTNFGTVVGTPQYMSPEQAEVNQLDIDTRSDIYSLGVLLYELLTGSTPFEKMTLAEAGLFEMLRIIREDEPPIPSTRLSSANALPSIAANRSLEPNRLTAVVRGELDWIVMKSLEKDRSRRYATANSLAQDIQRYLTGEPVEAGPVGTAYRLRKFARRHKAALATTTAFLLLLLLGTGVSIWQAIRATHAEQRANAERDAAIAEKKRGDAEAATALAVNEFLQKDLLAQADIANQTAGVDRNRNITVRDLLDRAAAGIDKKFHDQPPTEAAIRATLGNAYRAVADYSQAQSQLEKSIALRKEKLGPRHPETLQSMHSLAGILFSRGELAAAEKVFGEILDIRRTDLGADHLDTLATQSDFGMHLISAGKFAEAETHLQQALQGRTAKLGPAHQDTLETVCGLAQLSFARGQYNAAAELYQQTIAGFRAALGNDHPYTMSCMGSLSATYLALGQHDQAERLIQEVLAIKREKFGPDHPETLHTMQNLALLLQEQKKFDEAEALYKKVLEARRVKQGVDHTDTLQTMNNFATCCKQRGQLEAAEALYRQVLAVRRSKFGNDHPETIVTLHNLAVFYRDQRRLDDALPLFLEAIAGARIKWGLGHPNTQDVFANLAMLHTRQGNPQLAEALLRELVVYLKGKPETDSFDYSNQLSNLTMVLLRQKKYSEAEPFARECLEIRTKLGPDQWWTFLSKALLGGALLGQNKLAEAEPLLIDGYQGMKQREDKIPSSAKPHLRDAVNRLVQLYESQGKNEEVERWRKQIPAGQ